MCITEMQCKAAIMKNGQKEENGKVATNETLLLYNLPITFCWNELPVEMRWRNANIRREGKQAIISTSASEDKWCTVEEIGKKGNFNHGRHHWITALHCEVKTGCVFLKRLISLPSFQTDKPKLGAYIIDYVVTDPVATLKEVAWH